MVQVKLVIAKRDDDGPHATLYSLLCSSAELADEEAGSAAEVEEVSQCEACWQKAKQDQSLSMTRPRGSAKQCEAGGNGPRWRTRTNCWSSANLRYRL